MTPNMAANSDAQLVECSLRGDRFAFAAIVKRYQSLVCSITYNATGSLSLSEDLAQETFLAAWKKLADLREPARLRSWLCGITRFLVGKEFRRLGREPIHAAETLDAIQEPASLQASPAMLAVSREEEAILWRALERIPDDYREPLILFYREDKSIERVAAELELSEDAVRQRLSRGRKLLHEEVVAFVEGTLSRTAPGQSFSNAVLAMLPAAPAATVGAGMAGKGAAMAKSGSLAAWLMPLAPFVGVLGGLVSHWQVVRTAPTARERRFQKICFLAVWTFVLAWGIAGQYAMMALRHRCAWSDQTFYAAMTGYWWLYFAVYEAYTVLWFRRLIHLRSQIAKEDAASAGTGAPQSVGSSLAMIAGMYLACFSVLIYLAWEAHDYIWAAITAGIMVVLGAWHFLRLRAKINPAGWRTAIGRVLWAWGTMLLIFNLRWDVWLAARRGTGLDEIHSLLPVWVVPSATLALLIWLGAIVALTKPRRSFTGTRNP
jgi:RNA polymerase sigma factor (sigma-70 family)